MSPKRRICMDPPQRSNPTTPDTSLLLAENVNLTTREECIELCYRMDIFSDVTFRVGDPTTGPFKIYKLHRLVLAGQSSYMCNLCVKYTDSNETIDLPEVQPCIFDRIVKWLYKAKLGDKTEDMAVIAKVYEVATNLKIKELETKCLDTLTQILEREKTKEEKGEVSILDEMLTKPAQTPGTNPTTAPKPLVRSNTEGTASTNRRESKTKSFFKGVMDKATTQNKDAGKQKEPNKFSTLSSSFLNRAKIEVRGDQRAASQPLRASMISHPYGASHLVTIPYPQNPGTMPLPTDAKDVTKPTARTTENPGSPKTIKKGSPYRNSTAF
ncbi:uncharacterized protein DFL_000391 [Arthrobotrys flagrans]|uniref:BTB domain-containing protein n=1 Tax=Arthrobotrys flagrans TaxID=97331 RepID=A0A437AF84_ARTFL|nr:hypothetical protein DFL_000391 [Arthrobotrys flagrans]